MKRKLAIFMSFVMLLSTAVILPADKEHPAKAEETVTASGYWTDVAEPFQTKDASGNALGDSRDNPIPIESAEQLAYLAKEINEGTKENNISKGKYYRLEKNIDLSGKYWTAIGIGGQEFQGSFNGNGKVIQGLTIDETTTKKTAGFFGDVYAIEKDCGLLEDITILGADIKGTYCYKPEGGSGNDKIDSTGYGAILAASVFGNDKVNALAEVVNCRVQGKLKFEGDWADGDGETAVGGIAGYTSYAYMSECTAQVDIYGDGRMGGFIAVAGNKSQFISCWVMGVVDGGWGVGGFVGEAWEESTFKYCCANVKVNAYDWNSGGFAGYANEMPQMLGCVASGNVASDCVNGGNYWSPQSGGFIGYCNGTVENCYALGKVSCVNEQYPAAGFAGVNVDGGTIKNSYYNSDQPSYCSGVDDNRTGDSSTCEVNKKDLTELNKELHENIGYAYSTKWENISLAEGCAEGYTGDINCAYDSELVAAGQVYQLKAHSWDEGVITTQPQPGKEGVRTFTCRGCHKIRMEKIKALPTTPPTATPTITPTVKPTPPASTTPSVKPTVTPTVKPTVKPTVTPASQESTKVTISENLTQTVKSGKTYNRLYWNAVKKADGYIIYGSQCNEKGKERKFKKIAEIKKSDVTSYVHRGCKKNTWYKYKITAYRTEGKKKIKVNKSLELHCLTKGSSTYANPSAVKVYSGSKLTMKKGDTKKIRASVILPEGKKTKWHTKKLRYIVDKPSILTVSAIGKIKAKKKGKAVIYVVAQNGVSAKVQVKITAKK